ncbi:hypothetical protein MMC27_001115 [Xylographa pallens]|nr:hypothetical protein [Xylographa pallens]
MAGKRKGFWREEAGAAGGVESQMVVSLSAAASTSVKQPTIFQVWRSRTGRNVGGGVAVSCASTAAVDDGKGLIGGDRDGGRREEGQMSTPKGPVRRTSRRRLRKLGERWETAR